MNSRLMDYLGEWNPQLVRELKGRLISRNITLSLGLSIVAQLVIFIAFISQIPEPDAQYGTYCIYQENSPCLVNWIQWKEDLNQVFYWILPLVLVSGGVYLLIADLAREERLGTLNFIRVSPQSSQSILMGKLLGVPVLLYLAVAIALPSYAASAIVAQVPLSEVLSFYLGFPALCSVFYSAAALFALMGGHQALVGAGLTFGTLWWLMYYEWYYYGKDWVSHQWFGFSLNGDNLFNVRLFALINCAIWTYWIWQGLHRRFRNPAVTLISKKQSYALVFCVNVLFLGLVTSYLGSEYDPKLSGAYLWFDSLRFIATLNLFLFLGLIVALSPARQTLLDWSRYAHKARPQAVFQDLIWGEKSPAPVAIAICATIAALIFIPWVLLWPVEMLSKLQAIAAIGFYIILASIYAVLAQIMLLIKSKKRALWVSGVVGAAIGLPLLTLALLGGQAQTIPELYLLSILSLSGLEYATATPIFMAFLGHLTILAGLSLKLRQQLNLAGESATKALLMGRKVS
ncbi:hypothetical protein NG796_08185 [Laspinema sp. A4]|uniref:hypothetical protein n=1 Tax=Laspinema sp. D2d TaxID=2953686 RepID=UPI0021BAE082|nr:hypothetical protein [Laspinema sp. D2d]MCT7983269.1 hypothetical protein [Laspinema sp. D2d]